MPLSHSSNHESVFLQILHLSSVSWKITPLYLFRSNAIYFSQKKLIKVQAFETFKCSGQNSPNSCYFWNNKLVFLQILHRSLVSWDITPLNCFSWNFIYFKQKDPIKEQIWWNFTRAVESLMGSFCLNHINFSAKKVQKSYLSWHWRVMQSLKKNWLVVSNMTWGIWWIFTQPLKSPKISLRWAIFVQSIWGLS